MSAVLPDRPLAAIGMRLLSTLLLTAMFALGKLAQDRGVHLVEVLFWRQFIMIFPVLAIAGSGPGLSSLRSARPLAHLRRSTAGLTGMALNFATVGLLPLAEAQSIWFTIPLFATILGAVWLKERVGPHRWGAVVVGFIGVLIVLQPGSTHVPLLGGALGLASSVMVAITAILVRQIGRTEPALTTVFWFGVYSSLALVVPLCFVIERHDTLAWAYLVALGLLGSLGQITLTYSLRFAPVSVVAPVDYASIVWAVLSGMLLFGDVPTGWTLIGTPIVIGSGLYIAWREHFRRGAITTVATD